MTPPVSRSGAPESNKARLAMTLDGPFRHYGLLMQPPYRYWRARFLRRPAGVGVGVARAYSVLILDPGCLFNALWLSSNKKTVTIS